MQTLSSYNWCKSSLLLELYLFLYVIYLAALTLGFLAIPIIIIWIATDSVIFTIFALIRWVVTFFFLRVAAFFQQVSVELVYSYIYCLFYHFIIGSYSIETFVFTRPNRIKFVTELYSPPQINLQLYFQTLIVVNNNDVYNLLPDY